MASSVPEHSRFRSNKVPTETGVTTKQKQALILHLGLFCGSLFVFLSSIAVGRPAVELAYLTPCVRLGAVVEEEGEG